MEKIKEVEKGDEITAEKQNHIIKNLNELQERVERLESEVAKMSKGS